MASDACHPEVKDSAAKLKSFPCAEQACMCNTVVCSRKAMLRSATSGLHGISTRMGADAWRTSRQFSAGLQLASPAHRPAIKARATGRGFNMAWIIPAQTGRLSRLVCATRPGLFWFTIRS
jgi:hypothetical protein